MVVELPKFSEDVSTVVGGDWIITQPSGVVMGVHSLSVISEIRENEMFKSKTKQKRKYKDRKDKKRERWTFDKK